jgi:hypothetical protein
MVAFAFDSVRIRYPKAGFAASLRIEFLLTAGCPKPFGYDKRYFTL